jgi:hypothetical protein
MYATPSSRSGVSRQVRRRLVHVPPEEPVEEALAGSSQLQVHAPQGAHFFLNFGDIDLDHFHLCKT